MSARGHRAWIGCLLGAACAGGALGVAGAAEPDPAEERYATEFSVVPFVGGNSDVGFGGGYIASLARLEPHPDLDGSGLGLAYGVGAGLRIASGKTFLLRLDGAWSPEAGGMSGYLLAGHMF